MCCESIYLKSSYDTLVLHTTVEINFSSLSEKDLELVTSVVGNTYNDMILSFDVIFYYQTRFSFSNIRIKQESNDIMLQLSDTQLKLLESILYELETVENLVHNIHLQHMCISNTLIKRNLI